MSQWCFSLNYTIKNSSGIFQNLQYCLHIKNITQEFLLHFANCEWPWSLNLYLFQFPQKHCRLNFDTYKHASTRASPWNYMVYDEHPTRVWCINTHNQSPPTPPLHQSFPTPLQGICMNSNFVNTGFKIHCHVEINFSQSDPKSFRPNNLFSLYIWMFSNMNYHSTYVWDH